MATQVTVITGEGSTSYKVEAGSRGPAGATGATGATGAQGDRAGLKYTFDDQTGAGAPSPGHLKFNSSTLSAVTRISIRDTDFDGSNTSALLALIDDSTSTIKARVVIRSNSNADASHFNFLVTSVTDEGNHHHINGTYVSGSAFTANEIVTFDFYQTGDKGEQGPNTVTTSTTTNITGIIKGNGSVVSQAISGTDYAAALGADDNYVTDAQLVVIGNTSGTNTGDQFTSVTSQRLIGRHAGTTGAGQEVSLGTGIEFSGSTIQRSALTGDITASAGSNATTLAGTIAGNKTFSGDMSFSSTTRPTSGGTGTPAATSLITAADGDARYSRITFGILATNFDGAQNSSTLQDVTGLTFSLEAGTYQIEAFINHNGNASYATAGTKTKLNFTGSSTGAIGHLFRSSDNATTSSSAPGGPVSTNPFVSSDLANRSQNFFIRGQFVATTSGTFSAQISQSVATVSANTTAGAGSYVRLIRTN